jgi:hypothetical protein
VRLGIGKGSTTPQCCGPLGCGDWPRGMGGGGGGGRSQGGEATDSCSATSAAAAELLFLALFLTADLVFSSVLGRGAIGGLEVFDGRGKKEVRSIEWSLRGFEASRRQPLLPFCAAAAALLLPCCCPAAALLLPCPWDETGGELGGKLETQNE